MGVDVALLGFAYSAGAASFFSPCSVGLLPAYVGYYLGTEDAAEGRDESLATGALRGAALGLGASLGFLALFLAVGVVVALLGAALLGPYLVWTSRLVGVAILLLGILLLAGKGLKVTPNIRVTPRKTAGSVLLFGMGYGLASLGCTLPVFLSVVLGALAATGPLAGAGVLFAYAAGMATLMTLVTVLLGALREEVHLHLRRAMPYVNVASALLMIGAGAYILYYYTVVIA